MPHVLFFIKLFEQRHLRVSDSTIFAELLMRCAWYLYECERNHQGLPVIDVALKHIEDKESLQYAIAVNILGLLSNEVNRPKKALEYFKQVLAILEKLLPPDDEMMSRIYNHISLAYTELRDWKSASTFQQKATDIRLKNNSPRIGNSYSNMSSILVGLGKPEEAEEILMKCPSLQGQSEESFVRTDNPRFSR